MKKIIIFLLFSSSFFCAQANTEKLALKSFKQKKFFTAASYLKSSLNRGKFSKVSSKLFSKLVPLVGIYPFLDLKFSVLKRLKGNSNIYYVIAKKHFFLKEERRALVYLKKISSKSPFYLSTLLHQASLYEIQGNYKKARAYAKKCMFQSRKVVRVTPFFDAKVSQTNREYIHDLCEQLLPRISYKQGRVKKARREFQKIPHNSYQFPSILFNSSWAYFRLNDLRQAVGRNLTFHAPLLDNYFIPETELVTTLSYLRLCQYDEAISVIKNFQKNVRDEIENFMKTYGLKNKSEERSFVKILLDKNVKKKIGNNFISKMFRVLKRNPGVKTLNSYFKRLKIERKLVKNKQDLKAYNRSKKSFLKFYNTYVKVKLVKYSKEIIKLSNILAEIEVDTYTFMKEKYYAQKKRRESEKSVSEKFHISSSIGREKNQHLWNFHGEFWADELGFYLPLLKDECEEKK